MKFSFLRSIQLIAAISTFALGASAAFATRLSHVDSDTVRNSDGTYSYTFTVFNDSHPLLGGPCGGDADRPLGPDGRSAPDAAVSDPSDCLFHRVTEWSMPYFGDSGITGVLSPFRWGVSVETIGVANALTFYDGGIPTWLEPADPFYFGASSPFSSVSQILRWYTFDSCGDGCFGFINPQRSRDGFGFTSTFGATAAPYDAGWVDERRRSGDPDFPLAGIPNSPSVAQDNAVPAPALPALLFIGFAAGLRVSRKLN